MIATLRTELRGIPDGAVVRVVETLHGYCRISWHGGPARLVPWRDVSDLRPSHGWDRHAKCARAADPDDYLLSLSAPVGRPRNDTDALAVINARARALCEGCPVLMDCAVDALRHPPCGVVRAGAALPDRIADAAVELAELAERLALPPDTLCRKPSGGQRAHASGAPRRTTARPAPASQRFRAAIEHLTADGGRFMLDDLIGAVPDATGNATESARSAISRAVSAGRIRCVARADRKSVYGAVAS